MSKVFAVAWRDFKHTALTKTFILAAVFFPVLMAVFMMVAQMFMNTTPPPLNGTLIVVDSSGRVEQATRTEITALQQQQSAAETMPNSVPGLGAASGLNGLNQRAGQAMSSRNAVRRMPGQVNLTIKSDSDNSSDNLARLKALVRDGSVTAVALVPPALLDPAPSDDMFELYVAPDINPDHSNLLEKAVGGAIVRVRADLAKADLPSVQALLHRPQSDTRRIRTDGVEIVENPIVKILIPAAFMMLLWISTFTSANYLLTSTIEEKSNKVMEVLLSAVSPMQLMTGKILGQGMVGMVMLVMYSGLGIAALVMMSMGDLIPPITLVYLLIYFVMAYFMIASIMAGVGSAVSDLREAQALVTPATLILIVPFILWFPISQNPNGLLATVASFIPPMTPFAMILRITGSEPVPTWQIIATIIYGYAMMVAMVGICAKIFRVGVLMYGKPPTPLELLKWVRYS
jgi:ABC-2 type transport system permease protein